MPESLSALELTRRLLAREAAGREPPDDAAAAARLACERIYRDLGRWLGPAGCRALFTRALSQARAEHPELGEIRVRDQSEPALDGVAESIERHGASTVARGLEALLVALLVLLGRLIGDDMAARLVGQSALHHSRDDESLE
jgi:hypothetical protein